MAVVEKEVEAAEGTAAVVVNGAAQMGSDEFMIPPDYLVSRHYSSLFLSTGYLLWLWRMFC